MLPDSEPSRSVLELWINSEDHFALVHLPPQAPPQLPSPAPQAPSGASTTPEPGPAATPPPVARLHSREHSVQDTLDLLMAHYLGIVPKPQTSAFEQPKGASAAFVKLICLPVGGVDLYQATRAIRHVLPVLARLIVFLSFLLVPVWLWVMRYLMTQDPQAVVPAVTVALLGGSVFLASDAIARNSAKATSGNSMCVTAQTLHIAPPPAQGTSAAPGPSNAARPEASRGQPLLAAVPAAGAASGGVGASQSAAKAAVGQPSVSGVDWSGVRKQVIALEYDVFGNELSEGVLPADVLPGRVRMLCEQVNVPYPAGPVTPQGLLEALKQVQQALGV